MHTFIRPVRPLLLALCCAGILLIALFLMQRAGSSVVHAATAPQSVAIVDYAFTPAAITVGINDAVIWTNTGTVSHNVRATTGDWKSPTLTAGMSYTHVFTQSGTFTYYCAFHPTMEAQVVVGSAATGGKISYLPTVFSAGITPTSATSTVTATGALWSNPSSWIGGKLPTSSAAVVIPAGLTMVLDVNTPALYSLQINGTLVFSDTNLNMSANWIMVHGKLQVGTEQQPFRSKAVITLTGSNKTEDIMGMGTKFLGTMGAGAIELHGARRDAVSWTRLAATVDVGASVMTLSDPVQWRVGDEIVIAPSGFDPLEAEKVTITGITPNGVRFAPPLAHTHWGQLQTIEGRTLDERAEVGLLTRDIVIQSDDPGTPTEDYDFYKYTRGFGGHVMISAGGQAHVEGVEFRRMGQTGNKARYPMHWHFTGEGSGQYIKNSSVNGSFHRALVTHGVNNVLVENNVVFSVNSHAFVAAEDGPETGNRFVHNLGILNFQLNPHDYSFGPDGRSSGQQEERPGMFWMTNPNNPMIGNVAAGTLRGQGFFYDGGTLSAQFEFRDNTAHSVTADGSGNAELLYPPSTRGYGLMVQNAGPADADPIPVYRFQNFTAYKNGLAGVWMEGPRDSLEHALLADHNIGGLVFQTPISDTLIVGQSANVTEDKTQKNFGSGGLLYPVRRGDKKVTLANVTFVNHAADVPALTFNNDSIQSDSHVAGLRFVNTPQRIVFGTGEGMPPLYGGFRDLDGSFAEVGSARDISPSPLDRRECTHAPALTAYICVPPSGRALGMQLMLDDASGTTASDASPFSTVGTLHSGASWATGKYGGGVSLNGSSGWIEVPSQLRLVGDFSLALWVKLNDLNQQNPIVGSATDSDYRLTFAPYNWGPTTYRGRLQLRNSNVNYNLAAETEVSAGSWNHVVLVRSGTLVTLYLNGVNVAEGENDDPMFFNAFGRDTNSYFGGQLDDLRLYDSALNVAQVQTVMSGGTP